MVRVILSGLSNPMAIYIQGQLKDFMNINPCVYVIVWPIFLYFERFLLE